MCVCLYAYVCVGACVYLRHDGKKVKLELVCYFNICRLDNLQSVVLHSNDVMKIFCHALWHGKEFR